MSANNVLKLKSKDLITTVTSFFLIDKWNDATCLSKPSNGLLQEFDIKENLSHNLQLDQFATSKVPTMNLPEIIDENGT
jgi:hypothetical protein